MSKIHCLFCSFVILVATVKFCDSANILAAVFTPSFSHQIAFHPIWRELSLRGHKVTLLTTDPIKDKSLTNLTEIDLSMSYNVMKEFNTGDLLTSKEESAYDRYKKYMMALSATAKKQLEHAEVQELMKNGRNGGFDLLMVEAIYPTQMAFAWWFQVPFIGLVSLDAPSRLHAVMGNPILPSVYPDANLPFHQHLSFWEQLASTLFLWLFLLYGEFILYPREDATVKRIFGSEAPTLSEIQRNMSALFINTNPIFHNVRPLVPTTVQIGGGLHMQKPTRLPTDVERFLDEANDGFVYFSLGTNVKSSSLDAKIKNVIIESFSELPFQVLWKFEDENFSGIPKNVKIVKWLPSQTAVLSHKNIKVFVTQCGLQSMEEAIFYNVPMVGIPFYGDQGNNAKILESKKLGVKIDPSEIEKNSFKDAILRVASEKGFRENLRKIAFLLNDQEKTGLERAIWWTEYVLRHKGTEHLKSPAANMPFYQYYSLTVIAFLICIIYIFFKIVKLVLKIVARLCGFVVRLAISAIGGIAGKAKKNNKKGYKNE